MGNLPQKVGGKIKKMFETTNKKNWEEFPQLTKNQTTIGWFFLPRICGTSDQVLEGPIRWASSTCTSRGRILWQRATKPGAEQTVPVGGRWKIPTHFLGWWEVVVGLVGWFVVFFLEILSPKKKRSLYHLGRKLLSLRWHNSICYSWQSIEYTRCTTRSFQCPHVQVFVMYYIVLHCITPPKFKIDTQNVGYLKMHLLSNIASYWVSMLKFVIRGCNSTS